MTSFQSRFEQRGMERGMQQGLEKGLEQGLKQGLAQGLERGLEQGIRRGEANILLHLLEQKFGPIDAARRQQIEQADPDTLLRWSSRVLAEQTIEQVLR